MQMKEKNIKKASNRIKTRIRFTAFFGDGNIFDLIYPNDFSQHESRKRFLLVSTIWFYLLP